MINLRNILAVKVRRNTIFLYASREQPILRVVRLQVTSPITFLSAFRSTAYACSEKPATNVEADPENTMVVAHLGVGVADDWSTQIPTVKD